MNSYVLLLRGINVSGQKKVLMSDLKQMLERLNLENIKTYIQSGNVVFSSVETSKLVLEKNIGDAIVETFRFVVPLMLLTKKDFIKIKNEAPFVSSETLDNKNDYFVILKDAPEIELSKKLKSESYPNETFILKENCIYLICKNGYGKAKCNNNFFEKKLKVKATTRNFKTMKKLVEMLEEN